MSEKEQPIDDSSINWDAIRKSISDEMRVRAEMWLQGHMSHFDRVVDADTPTGRLDGKILVRWLFCEQCGEEFVFSLVDSADVRRKDG